MRNAARMAFLVAALKSHMVLVKNHLLFVLGLIETLAVYRLLAGFRRVFTFTDHRKDVISADQNVPTHQQFTSIECSAAGSAIL